MPELCRFFGIVIRMYHDDHPPPHFHATHAGRSAKFAFDGTCIAGGLPRRIERLVRRWALQHTSELERCWERARSVQDIGTIEPLR